MGHSTSSGRGPAWKSDKVYRYHGTSPDNLDSIADKGILPSKRGEYGKGVYFAPDYASAEYWAHEQGVKRTIAPTVLRVRGDKLAKYGYDEFPDQGFTDNKKVSPEDIEVRVFGDNGYEWIPIQSRYGKKNKRR